jgi:hypothetical protein
VLQWMLDGGRFLVRGRIGRNAQEVEGILLRHDALEASVARSFTRCGVCGRIEANGTPNSGCASLNFHGKAGANVRLPRIPNRGRSHH